MEQQCVNLQAESPINLVLLETMTDKDVICDVTAGSPRD